MAIEAKERPVALILTRQAVPTLDRSEFSSEEGVRKGAYILSDPPDRKPQIILIASGSELSLIVDAKERLEKEGIGVRCVSMPSWSLFEEQTDEYKNSVFPKEIKARLAVEAASPFGWERYVGDLGKVIGVTTFGASAPGATLMREYGFSVEHVCEQALRILKPGLLPPSQGAASLDRPSEIPCVLPRELPLAATQGVSSGSPRIAAPGDIGSNPGLKQ
jgi:transketolase